MSYTFSELKTAFGSSRRFYDKSLRGFNRLAGFFVFQYIGYIA